MKIKKNAKYAVACVSSMGLRITPEDRMAVHNSNRFINRKSYYYCSRNWTNLRL